MSVYTVPNCPTCEKLPKLRSAQLWQVRIPLGLKAENEFAIGDVGVRTASYECSCGEAWDDIAPEPDPDQDISVSGETAPFTNVPELQQRIDEARAHQ